MEESLCTNASIGGFLSVPFEEAANRADTRMFAALAGAMIRFPRSSEQFLRAIDLALSLDSFSLAVKLASGRSTVP